MFKSLCPNISWFSNFDDGFKQTMKLGNYSTMEIVGKSNVKLKMNGLMHMVTNVYYFPELKNNLLCIGQLQEKGLTVMFKSKTCKVFHDKK